MKTVFTNSQVVHVWASQTQEEGRNSKRSIFFEGPSIYSYGRHFEMARFITPHIVFVNPKRYSVTTSSHQSGVYYAIRHKTVFTVPSFDNHSENLTYLVNEARNYFDKAKRARVNATWFMEQGKCAVKTVREYLEAFPKESMPVDIKELWSVLDAGTYLNSELREKLIEREREIAQEKRRQEKEREAKRLQEELADLELWKAGQNVGFRYFSATALRINGDEVETTKGARVPLIEARKAYRALSRGIDLVGRRIGHFTVSQVTDRELVVGCHNIPMSEVHRIGPMLMNAEAQR